MSKDSSLQTAELVDLLAEQTPDDSLLVIQSRESYLHYSANPVGFCRDVLHEKLTEDVMKMMNSIRDNITTVAVSSNAVGKSHGAARVAVWFYLCHEDCKVFTAAAPPFNNLKNILWGEIGSIVARHP
jgi:hypothetical protein